MAPSDLTCARASAVTPVCHRTRRTRRLWTLSTRKRLRPSSLLHCGATGFGNMSGAPRCDGFVRAIAATGALSSTTTVSLESSIYEERFFSVGCSNAEAQVARRQTPRTTNSDRNRVGSPGLRQSHRRPATADTCRVQGIWTVPRIEYRGSVRPTADVRQGPRAEGTPAQKEAPQRSKTMSFEDSESIPATITVALANRCPGRGRQPKDLRGLEQQPPAVGYSSLRQQRGTPPARAWLHLRLEASPRSLPTRPSHRPRGRFRESAFSWLPDGMRLTGGKRPRS